MTAVAGSIALVTGGQRGLGRAFARQLLADGAERVYVTARTPVEEDDPRLVPLALDVHDDHSVHALAERVADVSIVVNNAGVVHPSPLTTGPFSDVLSTFETNVFGALRVARAFAPVLASSGGGALVNIHSALSWIAGAAAYGASKAALWSITNSLRIELAEQGTLVVGVHLGLAETEMTQRFRGDKLTPSEVAKIVIAGLELGETEILVDEISRTAKQALSGPVEGLTLSLS